MCSTTSVVVVHGAFFYGELGGGGSCPPDDLSPPQAEKVFTNQTGVLQSDLRRAGEIISLKLNV